MNKNIALGISAIVLIIAIGWLVLARTQKQQQATQTQQPSTSSAPATSSSPATKEQKSLRDLLSLNVAQQCTFSDGTNNGTTYVSSGKVRSDFTSMADGKSVSGHVIVQDNTSYFWTDSSKTGFKTTIDTTTQQPKTAVPATESIDIDTKGNYTCNTWVASDAMFALPSGITFTDLSQMMQGIPIPK